MQVGVQVEVGSWESGVHVGGESGVGTPGAVLLVIS